MGWMAMGVLRMLLFQMGLSSILFFSSESMTAHHVSELAIHVTSSYTRLGPAVTSV